MTENSSITTSKEEQPVTNDDLFEHHRIIVDKGQQLLRIDKFLKDKLSNTSRNRIQNAADAGNILINSKPVKSSYKVKPGDIISIVLPYPPRVVELFPEEIPLNIVFEDDELIIINKQTNLVVHPGVSNYSGTLVNGLLYHLNKNVGSDFESNVIKSPNPPTDREKYPLLAKGGEGRPGLVHRLDKNTTGLMVIAKSELALSRLAKQFFDRTVTRTYTALVWGDVDAEEGTIEGNIGRDLKNRKTMAVFPGGEHGKHAVTHYKVLERFGYVTVVECKLETGRTHQIRVHFKHIGHPLFNDADYGGDKIIKSTTFTKYNQFIRNCFKALPRQALHARSLGFVHPGTGKEVYFESELPDDMNEVIEKWRRYAGQKR